MPRALGTSVFADALPLWEKGVPIAATPYFTNLISADSHVMEPYEIWWKACGTWTGCKTCTVSAHACISAPSDEGEDYMRTRVYHGLIDDAYGPEMIPLLGTDHVLWGSDFPHIRSIGLEVQEHVHGLLGALPQEDQAKVVSGSAARVFNIA
jgi:hypothetical protein